MPHFFSLSFVFRLFFSSMLLYACIRQEKVICNEDVKTESIALKYPQKTVVEYRLARNFVDVSQYVTFRRWGPDETQQYALQLDTLTISWYENSVNLQDSTVYNLIKNDMEMYWMLSCNYSIFRINLNELSGFIGEAICKDHAKMFFLGANASTGQSVKARFDIKLPNSNFRNEFVCILNSMHFKQ